MSSVVLKNTTKSLRTIRVVKASSSRSYAWAALGLVGAAGLAGGVAYKQGRFNGNKWNKSPLIAGTAIVNNALLPEGKSEKDYQEIYNDIAEKIEDNDDFDGGAGFYGQLVRLSWHLSGTYDKKDNSGGSYTGSMIYAPESFDGANNGLEVGREFLYEFKEKYPWISRGDLWTLGGVVAVQEAGGPKIPWRPGRQNSNNKAKVPENGRLPDASKDGKYVRNLFGRMGFNDQEIVALLGAHCLGKCHKHNSGYDGPWVPAFNMFTNSFYVELLKGWHVKKWDGEKQYEDDESNSLMMLPTDMALKEESYFVKYVKKYAADEQLFFKDFAKAYSTLLELGITYPKSQKPYHFKTREEQSE
jgi:cytochrome c peroxidase